MLHLTSIDTIFSFVVVALKCPKKSYLFFGRKKTMWKIIIFTLSKLRLTPCVREKILRKSVKPKNVQLIFNILLLIGAAEFSGRIRG